MEHISKFLQVGPSNVIFAKIRFIQPSDDWFSLARYKAVEAKLASVLESKLPEITSLKPGVQESLNGDITMEDVKVTYNLRKRVLPPALSRGVIQMRHGSLKDWETTRQSHVDTSICKYRDYGGLFQRKTVLQSELVVQIRRLTASEISRHMKVENSQASREGISSYFRNTAQAVPAPQEKEKETIKRLLVRQGQKRKQQSSSDSENVDSTSSEQLKPEQHQHQYQQRKSLVQSTLSQVEMNKRSRGENTTVQARQPSPEFPIEHSHATRPLPVPEISKSSEGSKPATSSHSSHGYSSSQREKKRKKSSPVKEVVEERSSSSRDAGRGHHSGSLVERDKVKKSEKKETTSQRPKNSQDERAKSKHRSEKDKPSRDKAHSSHRKDDDSREKRHRRDDAGSSSTKRGRELADERSAKTKRKMPPPVVANTVKQLLADCGIGDSDSDDDRKRATPSETVRTSPDSTQPTENRKAASSLAPASPPTLVPRTTKASRNKRESMDDFKVKDTATKKPAGKENRKKRLEVPSRSVLVALDSDDEDCEDAVRITSVAQASAEEYDPATTSLGLKGASQKSRATGRSVTPVLGKTAEEAVEEYMPMKAATNSTIATEAATSSFVLGSETSPEDAYVPSFGGPARLEAASYVPTASPHKQEEKRRREVYATKQEYIPSAVTTTTTSTSSSTRSSRGRYEEYVPEAVGSTARRQQFTVDYVPTPKMEVATPPRTDTPPASKTNGSAGEALPSTKFTASSKMDQEIRNAREVRDLEERHIKYLFNKCLPEIDGIIKKKVESWRNADYHRGGKAKRQLTYKVYFASFSDYQMSLISDLFMEEFVLRRRVSGDYLHQVLIPEFLIRVFTANKGTPHEESDRLMEQIPFNVFDIPLH